MEENQLSDLHGPATGEPNLGVGNAFYSLSKDANRLSPVPGRSRGNGSRATGTLSESEYRIPGSSYFNYLVPWPFRGSILSRALYNFNPS